MNIRIPGFAMIALAGFLQAQQPPPAPDQTPVPDSGILIRTETNLVLVDSVVTDKKGSYVTDLKQKDFKVYQDGKEQPIKSFSFEADPAAGVERKHYLALVFDNGSMSAGDQIRARQAAAKFIDDNAGPDRLMTVVNFNGIGSAGQEFTPDPAKLKAIVNGLQVPTLTTMSSGGRPTVEADFAIRSTLENLRTLAKSMSVLPGRKMLVWFTAGFGVHQEEMGETLAIISECNRANVAIYPVDVRGVMTNMPSPSLRNRLELPPILAPSPESVFQNVAFVPSLPFAPQARGGTSPSGGASSGGGGRGTPSPSAPSSRPSTPTTATNTSSTTSRTTAPTTSNNGGRGTPTGGTVPPGAGAICPPGGAGGLGSPLNPATLCSANRVLIPQLPPSAVGNQQVMFLLADGTGGFVIHDDNDILAGLEKIGKEQNQYYLLGYTPPEAKPGVCHEIKVKVDRGGTEVRARSGYCDAKPLDILSAASPVTKGLESEIADAKPGKISGGMRAPFFYTQPNVARVNLAMDVATDQLKFEKKKGGLHSEVDFLGIAYTQQGKIAARFSDTVNLDYTDKDDADAAKRLPLHYENQFDIAAGQYTLKVAYSEGGGNFGRLEMPLNVDAYKADTLAVSALALSKQYHKVSELGGLLDVAALEDKTPLVAGDLQIVPTGDAAFAKSDLAIFYFEIYEPLLTSAKPDNPPKVGIKMRVLDRKSGEQKVDTGMLLVDPPPQIGNPVVRMGERMPVSGLPAGAYKLELTVADSADRTAQRTADFDIQ